MLGALAVFIRTLKFNKPAHCKSQELTLMAILNVEHQFSLWKNILALNGAVVHIMWARGERPSFSSIFLSLRCLYSWLRMVWLIGISKPADYLISHLHICSADSCKRRPLSQILFLDVVNRSRNEPVQSDRGFKQRTQAQNREEAEKRGWTLYEIFPLSVCVISASDVLFVKLFSPFQKPPARL